MFYFNTNELGFTPEFLGQVRLASCVASLAGVLIYRTLLKDWSVEDVLLDYSLEYTLSCPRFYLQHM